MVAITIKLCIYLIATGSALKLLQALNKKCLPLVTCTNSNPVLQMELDLELAKCDYFITNKPLKDYVHIAITIIITFVCVYIVAN